MPVGPPIRVRLVTAAVAAALAASAMLAACGGDDADNSPSPAADAATETSETVTETTAEPPPEAAPGDPSVDPDATTSPRNGDGSIGDGAATGPQSCPDVVITPNSGDGLFNVEAEGITCEDAAAALEAWGSSGYPGAGPPGFSCEEVEQGGGASTRLSCEQDAAGAVVAFDTGN